MADILFEQATPVLWVESLGPAITFYAQIGFGLLARFESYALLKRDGISLHLRVPAAAERISPEGNSCGAYFYLRGVDGFAAQLRDQGVESLGEPTDQAYGVREFAISDPDGNLLRFGEVRR